MTKCKRHGICEIAGSDICCRECEKLGKCEHDKCCCCDGTEKCEDGEEE